MDTQRIAVPVLLVALLVTSIGWWRAASDDSTVGRFETCALDGDQLTLSYAYGVNQLLAPSVDTRDPDKVVVELREATGGGNNIDIGLGGQATFGLYGADEDTVVEYADGKRLACD